MTPRRRTLSQPIDGATYDTWRTSAPEDDEPRHGRRCTCEGCGEARADAREFARGQEDW